MKSYLSICSAALAVVCLAGCASAPNNAATNYTAAALAATTPDKTGGLDRGSPAEQAAIDRFEKFNSDFSPANITNNTKTVYAAEVYFRDPFKQIHGEAPFEQYLLRSSAAVAEYHMDWQDVAVSDGNYYFRWVMSVKLKRDGKSTPPGLTTGISHVRFNRDGLVVFHQDYFDAAAFLYERVPILGSEIRFIKKRL